MVTIPELTAQQLIRFWSKVRIESTDDCWYWTRGRDKDGYGKVSLNYGDFRSHRVAHFLATGHQPGGFVVCHECDNPPCCNPSHLWLGTIADNDADRDQKGRASGPKGVNNPVSKLTVGDVLIIRSSSDSQQVLADRLDVSRSLISMIRNRVIWKHVA